MVRGRYRVGVSKTKTKEKIMMKKKVMPLSCLMAAAMLAGCGTAAPAVPEETTAPAVETAEAAQETAPADAAESEAAAVEKTAGVWQVEPCYNFDEIVPLYSEWDHTAGKNAADGLYAVRDGERWSLFSTKTKDFITAVDEKNIIIVKEIKDKDTYEDLEKTAQVIVDMLNTEAMARVRVAFGTIIKDIKEVSRSYKEAKMALDVGKIFYSDKKVMAYSNLGIGRLIYQLPLPLCKMFIKEIFDDNTPDNFDEETLTTINKFFENNLNVSETSRQLYIHRNTLVYRLDKLQKSTGLDLRVFEDAITFKIALMVVKYMKYMESLDY